MNEKRVKIRHLRTPWVPAPAKSSSSANVTAPLDINKKVIANEYPVILSSSSSFDDHTFTLKLPEKTKTIMSSSSHNLAHPSNSFEASDQKKSTHIQRTSRTLNQSRKSRSPHQRHTRRPSSQVKKVKHGYRRTGMQYTLQSKDSLIDVTACLQEKREEVMKLWEKSILQGDPDFLSNIENANRLALEAAEEVEKLRRKIQDYQNKEEGLSDSDCVQLERMRVNVLEKVKKFEEADNLLQANIAKQSVSKTSLASSASKTSQTQTNNANHVPITGINETTIALIPHQYQGLSESTNPPLVSTKESDHAIFNSGDVIVLKENKPLNFSEESESENDALNVKRDDHNDADAVGNQRLYKCAGRSSVTLDNLSRLKLLYEENLTIPALQEIMNLNNGLNAADEQNFNKMTFDKQEIIVNQPPKQHHNRVRFTEESHHQRAYVQDTNSGSYEYHDKISALQRHLMDTEHEVEELKSEIERIESDANFRVRLLQNSVQDKFESLQVIPDYLQLVDQKLNEAVQEKARLQNDLESKNALIKEIKEQNNGLQKQLAELRDQLRKSENSNDFLSFKNTELEKSNIELRNQVENLTKQVAEMTWEIKVLKTEEPKTGHTHDSGSRGNPSWENQKLKIQCAELKDQISQSKRIIHSLRKSKTKVVSNLNDRIEELMDALQHAQHHKRVLGDQIRYLKKSYHELFPPDMFKPCSSKKPSRANSKKNAAQHHQKPVEEPKLQPTFTWQTGTGIKLDDLLQVKIP